MKNPVKYAIFMTLAIITICFTGCVVSSNTYKNADKYSAGNADFEGGKVKSLDINWISGNVKVTRHDLDTVVVTETSDKDLKEAQEVHTWLDGNVLRIQYCKSGESFIFKKIEKDLEIKIPKDMELEDFHYDGASGNCSFQDISADTFDIDSSSGDVTLKQKGESSSIDVDVSSGKIDVTAETVDKIDADSSSGKIKVTAENAKKVKADASSGNIELHFANVPSDTEADASSGDITIYVPEDSDFTADVDTSSGDFDSDIALTKDGSKYINGDGSNDMNLNTSSGDIEIKAE